MMYMNTTYRVDFSNRMDYKQFNDYHYNFSYDPWPILDSTGQVHLKIVNLTLTHGNLKNSSVKLTTS